MSDFLQILLAGISNGMTYAIVAIGFVVIYNATSLINFAQGEFAMIGGLSCIWISSALQVPLWLALPLAAGLGALVAGLMERLCIRPHLHRSPINLIIVTIAISILLQGIAMFIWGKQPMPLDPFIDRPPLQFGGMSISWQHLLILLVGALCMIGLHLFFRHTHRGRTLVACSIDRKTAALMGIDVRRATALAFLISGFVGALAGVMLAPITMMSYQSGSMLGLKGFCAAILGGLGSVLGGAWGGILIGVLESLTAGYLSSGYKDAVAFVIMLSVLFLRPQGLFGGRRVNRV